MTKEEKIEALRTIIADSERLRNRARDAGCDMLAFQLELVLYEARSILMGRRPRTEAARSPSRERFRLIRGPIAVAKKAAASLMTYRRSGGINCDPWPSRGLPAKSRNSTSATDR
jgi:hypothetical protein